MLLSEEDEDDGVMEMGSVVLGSAGEEDGNDWVMGMGKGSLV